MKHSVLFAQLLFEEVDTETTNAGCYDLSVFCIRLRRNRAGMRFETKSSPNNMPISEHDIQSLQKMLWAKAEGIER